MGAAARARALRCFDVDVTAGRLLAAIHATAGRDPDSVSWCADPLADALQDADAPSEAAMATR